MKHALLVLLALAWFPTRLPAAPMPPVSDWIPQEAVLVLEVTQPQALLEPLLRPNTAKAIESLPAYQHLAATPQFTQFCMVINHLETQLGVDWRTALRQLLSGGLTFAVGPHGEILLAIDSADTATLNKLHEIFLGFARGEAANQGQPDRVVSKEYRGLTGWSFGPKEVHVILDHRLLISNQPQVLKAVLDRRAEPQGLELSALSEYQAAKAAAGTAAAARLFVNMTALKQNPGIARILARDDNPLAALLLAGIRDALRKASWLGVGLQAKADTLILQAVADAPATAGAGSDKLAWTRPGAEGALPNLRVPREIGAISLYRDLHGFYAAKDDLFPERTSGLIFFENMMGIFFSGLDLTEQVFAETRPEIRLVAAGQEYDPAVGTPAVQFPGFAVVLRLRHPDRFGQTTEEAWQKALGLINFTRGQKALPGLIIDRYTNHDTKCSVAYFPPPATPEPAAADPRYNLRPALARLGDYLVLSTTDKLANDLLDALARESATPLRPLAATDSVFEIDGAHLLAILLDNREQLIRKNMLDKGHTREQADSELGMLLTMLSCIGHSKLSLAEAPGRTLATWDLQLRFPDSTRLEKSTWTHTSTARPPAVAAHPVTARDR